MPAESAAIMLILGPFVPLGEFPDRRPACLPQAGMTGLGNFRYLWIDLIFGNEQDDLS
jgi:hypothetical protein